MRPLLVPVPQHQRGVFTAAQAREAGISDDERRHRVRRKEWLPLRRGVYVESARWAGLPSLVEQHRVRVIAAQLSLGRPSWASGLSACAVHDALPPHAKLARVWLTCMSGQTHSSRDLSVAVWPLSPQERTTVAAIPVLSGARTIFDVARSMNFADAVTVADQLLRSGSATRDRLHELVLDLHGRPGAPAFARVATFADGRSESPGESLSRVWFAEVGLPTPALQVEFLDDAGFVAITDFYWPEHRTVGEFDGQGKYRARSVLVAEKRREDRLREDYEVVRWDWQDLHRHPRQLRRRITDAFDRGARRPPTTRVWVAGGRTDDTATWR